MKSLGQSAKHGVDVTVEYLADHPELVDELAR